jgi:uncharacterized SAM-binding protein YcdF (DUF218 family)
MKSRPLSLSGARWPRPFVWLGRASAWACGLLGFLVLLATCTPFVSWYGKTLAGRWEDPRGDTLIVLAGGDLDGGFPSENTVLRCLYAVRAYREGPFRKVVVTGFQTGLHMRNLLVSEGVPAEAVVTDNASTTTRESALRLARLLAADRGSKVLLTSDFHMFRAARVFRKAGIEVLPRPIPDARKRAGTWLKRWPALLDEAAETVKIVWYFAHGWM